MAHATLGERHSTPDPGESLLRDLITAIRNLPVSLADGVPNSAASRERLRAGIPALAGEALIDGQTLRALATTLVRHLVARTDDSGVTARALAHAFHHSLPQFDWDALAELSLAGRWDALPEAVRAPHVDLHALAVVIDWATRPVLRAAAERVRGVMRDAPWGGGRCPCCGSLPLLAEVRDADAERGRALRCGRCASAWDFVRVGCADCGERDHRQLGYVHVDGEAEYRRIACCASCMFYIKELATLTPFTADELLEADLATAALDVLAVERGYRRRVAATG